MIFLLLYSLQFGIDGTIPAEVAEPYFYVMPELGIQTDNIQLIAGFLAYVDVNEKTVYDGDILVSFRAFDEHVLYNLEYSYNLFNNINKIRTYIRIGNTNDRK